MVWTAGREDEFSGFSQLNESSVIKSDLYPCLLLFEWVNTYIEQYKDSTFYRILCRVSYKWHDTQSKEINSKMLR